MVASTNADIYSPFHQPMINEDGPQSSEEGSGLHSPVFGAPYPTHGDSCEHFVAVASFSISNRQ